MKKRQEWSDSLTAAAGKTGHSVAQLKVAKRLGCDAFVHGRVNIAKLQAWFAANTPDKETRKPAKATSEPDREGAPAALDRLAVEEARLYREMEEADSAAARSMARGEWLKVSEQLRRHDLAVEEARRGAGELIPRAEVEKMLEHLGWCLKIGSQFTAEKLFGLCRLTEDQYHLLNTTLTDSLVSCTVAMASHNWKADVKPSPWMLGAVSKGVR